QAIEVGNVAGGVFEVEPAERRAVASGAAQDAHGVARLGKAPRQPGTYEACRTGHEYAHGTLRMLVGPVIHQLASAVPGKRLPQRTQREATTKAPRAQRSAKGRWRRLGLAPRR